MAEQFVLTKIKGDKVVLFIKPTCPYCNMAKGVLSQYKIKPGHLELIDISALSDVRNVQDYLEQLTGARTVKMRCHIHTKCFPALRSQTQRLNVFRLVEVIADLF